MTFRNLILTTACALASTAGLRADNACMSYTASGTYLTSITGWATVATTPAPVVAPVVAQGVTRVDDSGAMSAVTPLTVVVAGAASTDSLTGGKIIMSPDCTVTFKATCASGCSWEGAGVFMKNAKEFRLIFTKTNGFPLTATVEMKQISN